MQDKVQVDHLAAVMAEVQKLILDGIDVAKHGVGLGSIKQLFAIVAEAKQLIQDAKLALPELKAMDTAEAAKLAEAAYGMIQAVVAAIA